VSYTEGGDPSYEAGVAGGMPVIDGTLGVRVGVWYRKDGAVDRINPTTLATEQRTPTAIETMLVRLAAVWAAYGASDRDPDFYYRDRYRGDVENYWPLYSDPDSNRFVNANPRSVRPRIALYTRAQIRSGLGRHG
jgi:hypothetical protein